MKLTILAFLGTTMIAAANPLIVTNASFETLPAGGLNLSCGAGCTFDIGPISGWTNSGVSGQVQPGIGGPFTSLSDGPTSAYSNEVGSISQTVGATVQMGVLYTLLVDLGKRVDTPNTATAALVVNGNSYLATGSFVAGGWGTFTATYLGTLADAGQAITIELRSNGVQGNFDNVRLSDSTTSGVPEPSTQALLGLGIAAAAIFRRVSSARR